MAIRFLSVILILLSLSASCLSDPVQNPETVFKRNTGEDGDQEETPIQTQIDQLYQIYQATQNNVIQLNTQISLFNEQLANLRDTVKTLKTGVSSDVVKLVSDVGTLKKNLTQLQKESKANFTQLSETVNTNSDAVSTQFSDVRYAMDVTNNNTCTKIETVQSSVDMLNTDRDTTTAQLSSLQSSVDTLTTRVNSPVNLYQNCIEDTVSCEIPQSASTHDWRGCYTPLLPITRTVSVHVVLPFFNCEQSHELYIYCGCLISYHLVNALNLITNKSADTNNN